MVFLRDKLKRMDEDKRNIIVISFFYFVTHFFLLIASGKWWDDWINYKQSVSELFKEAMELGRPTSFIPCFISMSLPECGYRILTFVFFYVIAVLFYKTLEKVFAISKDRCMLITLLLTAIPINDARIMNAVFPYSFGLLFFAIAFYQLTYILEEDKAFSLKVVFNLLLFVIAFSLNSVLVFYASALLLILVKKREKSIRYFEYLLLPIIYYLVKKVFFSQPVGYEDYNTVTIDGLIYGMKNMLFAINAYLAAIIRRFSECGSYFVIVFILLAVFACMYHKTDAEMKNDMKKDLLILACGIIVLALALFPYIVVRVDYSVVLTGTKGRDYILAGFGTSMIFYSLIDMIVKESVQKALIIMICVLGAFHFNLLYLEYQEDYYRQLGFQKQLIKHSELKNLNNLIYVSDSENEDLGITRFFTLNGNAAEAYGNENRLVIDGLDGIWILRNKDNLKAYKERTYKMSGYDVDHDTVDAIVENSCDISKFNVLKLKLYELFDREKFNDTIMNYSSMEIYLGNIEEYEKSKNQ